MKKRLKRKANWDYRINNLGGAKMRMVKEVQNSRRKTVRKTADTMTKGGNKMNKRTVMRDLFTARVIAACTLIVGLAFSGVLTGCSAIEGFAENDAVLRQPVSGGIASSDSAHGSANAASSVAIVLGAHSNSCDVNLNSLMVKETVSGAIETFGFVSVISIDGKPDLIAADLYAVPERYRDGNPQLLMEMAHKKTANLLNGLTQVRANDPEVDTLEALRLAVRTLESAPDNSEKVILVLDTGLSTTGLLDFRNNLISAEPQAIANLLTEKQAIPDFSGITVKWQQLGDVHSPQPILTPAQVKKLEEIWKAVIEKTGGVFESSRAVANPGCVGGELPTVSVVELPPEAPVVFDPVDVKRAVIQPKKTVEVSDDVFNQPRFLSSEQVRFVGDSDVYLDPKAAIEAIKPIAEYMAENSSFTMLLIGTTAGDDHNDYSINLSNDRANAVRRTLVSLGVEEKRILTLGLGSADPWHIYGVGKSGELAAQNRKVVLLSADSPEAVKLMRMGEK